MFLEYAESDYGCGKCKGVNLIQMDETNYFCPACGDHYEIDENFCEEKLSEWDAADIYYSNGCDEDYMFGYSEDELYSAYND